MHSHLSRRGLARGAIGGQLRILSQKPCIAPHITIFDFPGLFCGILLAAACALFPRTCASELYHANPANYLRMLRTLAAGDVLLLQAGTYESGLPLHRINGEPGRPIVVRGPAGGARAVFTASRGSNTISIVNSSHLVIRDLELDGRGLPVDAIKAEGHADWAHHITLEHLLIRGHGDDQQTVAISTKCPAWDWLIRNNVIRAAGTGLYLGNADGSAAFFRGIIEHNLIVDSIGYNLQLKHQNRWPEVGVAPEQGFTIIRHNVFSKSANSSTDKAARPNVLVGHWPLQGPGSNDTYLVYGNFFYQNPGEALFQGEGNIALYDNLFVNPYGDAVRIQPHNDAPRQVNVFHNTVVAEGSGIVITGGGAGERQAVSGNAVFARNPIVAALQEANLTGPLAAAAAYLAAPDAPLGKLDLSPSDGKLAQPRVDGESLRRFADWDRDFDGKLRTGDIAGAYIGAADWLPQLLVKPAPGR